MLRRVLGILLMIAIIMLCYWVTIWVLGLLGIVIPQQILTCVFVILCLVGALAVIGGKFDNINWW